jgi:hypothetical protein
MPPSGPTPGARRPGRRRIAAALSVAHGDSQEFFAEMVRKWRAMVD